MEGVSIGNNNNDSINHAQAPSPSKSSAGNTPQNLPLNSNANAGGTPMRVPSPSLQKGNPNALLTGQPSPSTPSPTINQSGPRNLVSSGEAPKSLRGLNKPKCSECGNVARSRCPFQACKSCCVKARNPCHIHVLKQNLNFTEKSPPQTAPLFDKQRTTTPSNTFSHVVSSRPFHTPVLHNSHPYLPGPLAQIRVKRPLSRKEIAAINSWRFVKLKDFYDSKIEAEDEAFERYMHNVLLLEDVFSLSREPLQGLSDDGHVTCEAQLSGQADDLSEYHIDDMLVEGLKVRLKSNTERSETHKERLRKIIDKGLHKLKREHEDKTFSEDENTAVYMGDHTEVKKPNSIGKARLKKNYLVNAFNDKMSKVRNLEDLNACTEMYTQIFEKNISGPSNVNIKQSAEPCRLEVEGDMLDVIPSEQEPTPMQVDVEENKSANSGLFKAKERQFLSNPEIYLKGWTQVNIPHERIENNYEDLLSVTDLAEL